MLRLMWLGAAVCLATAGCEEGPDQVFKPLPENFDRSVHNGFNPVGHLTEGDQPFEFERSGKQENTAVICEADETAARWAKMVKEPIIPTVGAGGLNLRGQPEWSGLTIDQAQEELCQAYVYQSNLYFWGDNAELLAFFDTKTRLITELVMLTGYEGTIKAGEFEILLNQAVQYGGKKLNNPTAPSSLKALNAALVKEFRPEMPNPEQRDCIEANTCYAYDWETRKVLMFNDVSLAFIIEPEGERVLQLEMWLKRAFSFTTADVAFEAQPAPTAGLPPQPKITTSASCSPTLGTKWDTIEKSCLGSDKLEKAKINADSSNEHVSVDMGGLSLYLSRPSLKADAILPDDVTAQASDEIVAMSFGIDYEGWLKLPLGQILQRFFAKVVEDVKAAVPQMNGPGEPTAGPGGNDGGGGNNDGGGPPPAYTWAEQLQAALDKLQPTGDADRLKLGVQKVDECDGATSCTEQKLMTRTHELVLDAITKAAGSVPEDIQHPNWLVERYLAEVLRVFNDDVPPSSEELYYYPTDDTADILVGVLSRKFNGERYAVRTAYHNKSDQLVFLFFKRGPMRTETVLFKDAELPQYDGSQGDGVYRLWNLARSPRVGLGTKMVPKPNGIFEDLRKAIIPVKLGSLAVDVLVSYNPQNSMSGFGIPVEGQRDKFEPAAYFGFSGNVIAAGIWAKDGIVRAILSTAFYDELDFCGVKVALWDKLEPFLQSLPADCEKIVSFSENGKFITAVSTYVAESPFKIGLRLWITAGRIDGAYYWAEE